MTEHGLGSPPSAKVIFPVRPQPSAIYRYSGAWRALGATSVLLFTALPPLMLLNNEVLERQTVVFCAIFVALGAWCYVYVSNYAVALDQDGFTLQRFAKPPMQVAWRDVVSLATPKGKLVLRTRDHRMIEISVRFPGYAPIEANAASHLRSRAAERQKRTLKRQPPTRKT